MQQLVSVDTTSLSYWWNWGFFLCALWVLMPMVVASILIWKYELSENSEPEGGTTQQCDSSFLVYYNRSWKPCIKGIHPVFLMVFRVIAFCLLFTAMSFDIAIHGFELFFYYTQWTFVLVTIYFGLGSLLSMHGCFYQLKLNGKNKCPSSQDMEKGLYASLVHGANGDGVELLEKLNYPRTSLCFWDSLFQVLFQMTAGAVTITDVIYWCVIFPFMALKDYEMNFLTVVTHSLNAVLLVGDTALNSLVRFLFSLFIISSGHILFLIYQQLMLHSGNFAIQ
ncbi:galactose/methyl galactoside import ATP-binding protein MglA [Striga asiatica]|uniref:Galactose/methyl galactoside import ATP-binding protein MglA n=1 Tax=Striga asiatica TaxID=4170 RepID=A0A5A7QRJ1_STRAF|nr:galactose/methyl galactoside import ATP-binding protein MglA [Striga asiatica]